jgi:hypothetical protein
VTVLGVGTVVVAVVGTVMVPVVVTVNVVVTVSRRARWTVGKFIHIVEGANGHAAPSESVAPGGAVPSVGTPMKLRVLLAFANEPVMLAE